MIGKIVTLGKSAIVSLNLLSAEMYGVTMSELTAGMAADVLKTKILQAGAAFLATPIGIITAAVGAVLALGAAVTSVTDAWQQQVEAAEKALSINEENIQKYEDEISSLEALEKKLAEAKGNKEALAEIQEELNSAIGRTEGLLNGESNAHAIVTQKIKDEIAIKKQLLKQEQEAAVSNNTEIFNNKGIKQEFLGMDFLLPDYSGTTLRNDAKYYVEKLAEFIEQGFDESEAADKAFSALQGKYQTVNTGYRVTQDEWQTYWNEQVKTAYNVFESTISSYDGFGGSSFIRSIIDNSVRSGYDLTEIKDIIAQISGSDIQNLVDEYYSSLTNPDADSEVAYNKILSAMEELEKDYPHLASVFDVYSEQIANGLNGIEEASENAGASVASFTDEFEELKKKNEILAEAQQEIKEDGKISVETLVKLLDEHEELVDYIDLETGAWKGGLSVLEAQLQAIKDKKVEELNTSLATVQAQKAEYDARYANLELLKDIGTTSKNLAILNMAETKAANDKQKRSVSEWFQIISSRPGYYFRDLDFAGESAEEDYNTYQDLINSEKKLQAQIAIIKNSKPSDYSGGDENEGKTAVEKYFDDLKHRRELDKINQKQYLIELYKGNEKYYKAGQIEIDEYASNMEELYNGFKELYKEDFEAKKESLEKQKEEVEKYYDNLIDKIKEANDEEDYEEEQAEKRKTIFELKAKIDDLLRDGSQRALARAAELREELADAEKELFDFERDNARENEIDRLEKEKEDKVASIDKQIENIDTTLSNIDNGIGNVYSAIVQYAKNYGVTINKAYATGTSNSVGGWSRINEKGLELIATPDGHGNYVNMLPASKVLTAQQTSTLMALSQGQLPQAMYNSIARSIGAKVNSPAVNNYNQPITINIGDIIVKGNADKSTVADLKKQREDIARIVLETIKPFTR